MTDRDNEAKSAPRSKAEMLERLVGPARRYDEEDLEFWRTASDEVRGRVFYGLLRMVNAIGRYPEKEDRFPGFPPSRKTSRT